MARIWLYHYPTMGEQMAIPNEDRNMDQEFLLEYYRKSKERRAAARAKRATKVSQLTLELSHRAAHVLAYLAAEEGRSRAATLTAILETLGEKKKVPDAAVLAREKERAAMAAILDQDD